jgi:pimeloyl-ACP methyl ester carboxylesterase
MIVLRAAVAPLFGAMIRRHIISRWAAFFLDRGLRSSSFPDRLPAHLATLPADHIVNSLAIVTMAEELRAFNRDMAILPKLAPDIAVSVLFGSGDRIVEPARHIKWLRQKHPSPVVTVLDGVGHMPHHVAPAVALRMLAEIVDGYGSPTTQLGRSSGQSGSFGEERTAYRGPKVSNAIMQKRLARL